MSRTTSEDLSAIQTLSPMEREVLRRITAGDSLSAIAAHLEIGEGEARQHRSSMMRKLGAERTADAVRIGLLAAGDERS